MHKFTVHWITYCATYLLSAPIFAESKNEFISNTHINYSPLEIKAHKKTTITEIISNPANYRDPEYQMIRALLTIHGTDTDDIPKISEAGQIYYDGALSYQLMHNGIKIITNSYYDTQWLTDVMQGLKGHHEPQEEKCFYEVLKYIPENATMFELGSYWGYYSLWFAFQIKGAKNYLIEPDIKRLEVGKRNFQLNNKSGNFRRGYLGQLGETSIDTIGAEYISIDDFMEKENIDHVNIIHADIQGGEYDMLKSAVKHLDKIDYFFISTHGDQTCHLYCLDFFKNYGFTVLAEHNQAESCSGDGLIVAKRKNVVGPEKISINKYPRDHYQSTQQFLQQY